jgi:hypothetical protein
MFMPERTFSLRNLLPLLMVGIFGFFIFGGLTSVTMEPSKLVLTHGLFEIASIVLGFIIFYITWFGTNSNNSSWVTNVSLVVFSSSIIELVYMLAYPGIPTELIGYKHVWVTAWIASRLIWSYGMLYTTCLLLTTNHYTFVSAKTLLYCTLIAVSALVANIVFSYNSLPGLSINEYDHPLAVYGQWAALIADIVALYILYRNSSSYVGKFPQLALLFATFSDFSFCLVLHTPYTLNIAGHLFKILANFYVLRSLYIFAIRQPYDEVMHLKEEMEELAAKNAKLYQESEHQRNLVEDILAKIGMLISSQLDLKETLDAIADMVASNKSCFFFQNPIYRPSLFSLQSCR